MPSRARSHTALGTSASFCREATTVVVEALKRQPSLEKPNPKARAGAAHSPSWGAHVAGGQFPLLPYVVVGEAGRALLVSNAMTLGPLFVFGFVKGGSQVPDRSVRLFRRS